MASYPWTGPFGQQFTPPQPQPRHHHHHQHRPSSFGFWDPSSYQPGHGVDHSGPDGFGSFPNGAPFGGPEGFWGARRGGMGMGMGMGMDMGMGMGRRGGGHHFNPWGERRGGGGGGGRHFQRPYEFDECLTATSDDDEDDKTARDAATPTTEKDASHATACDEDDASGDAPEAIPDRCKGRRESRRHNPRGGMFGARGGAGARGRGGLRGWGRHHAMRRGGPRGGPVPFEMDAEDISPFDLRGMMNTMMGGPSAAGGFGNPWGRTDDEEEEEKEQGQAAFRPPVDVFGGHEAWTVHVALPGAKKEDVLVAWDAGRMALTLSGVVHRPGDEALLAGLVTGERRVGQFKRRVRLPGAGTGDKDRVDGEGITARMEDGVLVVVVPKMEKGWTEVLKVDIE